MSDQSVQVGGKQAIFTNDGHIFLLSIWDGLAYLALSKPTEEELANLPHIVLISDTDWDPHVLDHQHDLDNDNVWYDALQDPNPGVFCDSYFGNTRDYIARLLVFDLFEDDEPV